MNRIRLLALLGILGFAAAPAVSQGVRGDEEERERPRQKKAAPPAGFWPTERMVELFLERSAEDLGRMYDFDDDQLYNTKQLLKERIPRFLNENRAELTQLTNEYIEALLGGQPPDPADVARWAERALPLFNELTDVCESVGEDMRTYLTEPQQVILDGQLAAFQVGRSYATQRLAIWSEGGYNPETDWSGDRHNRHEERRRRREMEAEMRQAELEARGELPPEAGGVGPQGADANRPRLAAARLVQAKDEWTRYVEDFIRRYQLIEDQQARAHKVLRSAHEQRDRYLRRAGPRIAQVQQKLKEAKTESARAAAEAEGRELARPLDRMFKQLKERLNKIPTRKQRVAAAHNALKQGEEARPGESGRGSGGGQGAKSESPGSP